MRILASLFAFAFAASSGTSYSDVMYGGGLEAGMVSTKSSEKIELDKNGSSYAGYFGLSSPATENSYLTLALGYQGATIEGSKGRRSQEVKANAGLLSIDYRYRIMNFEPGILVRVVNGKTASLRAADEVTSKSVVNLGGVLAYRWQKADADWVAYLAGTTDMSVKDQVNTQALLGLQYWIKPSKSAEPSPVPELATDPGPTVQHESPVSVETPPLAPKLDEEPKPTVLRFKPVIFSFQKNSGSLVDQSKKNADSIAKVLASQADGWDRLEISGHADSGGNLDRNQKLSQLRATSVQQALEKGGVSADRMSAKGFGSSQPLPGKDPSAPENRRVEIRVEGAKDFEALVQSLKQFLVE